HEEGDDEGERQRGRDGATSAHGVAQPLVERPARKGDDERREHRYQEAVEEIDARRDDEHEQPSGRREWRDERDAGGRGKPEQARFPLRGPEFLFAQMPSLLSVYAASTSLLSCAGRTKGFRARASICRMPKGSGPARTVLASA